MSCAPGGIGPKGGRRRTNSFLAEPQQIRQVRLAAAELPHAERPLRARQMRAQIRFEPARIEPFVGPLVDQLGGFEAHFRNSIRAIARLWTSSGPSTMRITRERAQA